MRLRREILSSAGPFLRVVWIDDDSFEIDEKDTKSAFNLALRQIERSDEIDGVPPQSHRVARYVTPKARDGDYITKELRPASDSATRRTGPCPSFLSSTTTLTSLQRRPSVSNLITMERTT
jgi:hypothetical protein